jgi:hypothetical protein
VTTKVSATSRPSKAPRLAPALTAEERLRVYTPEEVSEKQLILCTPRWLRDNAYKRLIPFTQHPSGIGFRLEHIDAINHSRDRWPAGFDRAA